LYVISACAQVKPTVKQSNAQNDSATFVLTKSIPGDFLQFDADILGNIYVITKEGQLKKLDEHGDSLSAWNDVKRFGNPGHIDATNPLKVLVYYPGFSTVVMLDRQLNLRNSINFRKENIFSVKTIAASYDNNIWIFDEQDSKLKKIDDQGKKIFESTDWRLLFDTAPLPGVIIDVDNFVYLYDDRKGFYVFDYYGSFKNLLPFVKWKSVAISNNKLFGFSDNKLYSYELNSLQLKSYVIPDFLKGYHEIKSINGKIYVLKENGLYIYNIK
jgi:hypothetical protein